MGRPGQSRRVIQADPGAQVLAASLSAGVRIMGPNFTRAFRSIEHPTDVRWRTVRCHNRCSHCSEMGPGGCFGPTSALRYPLAHRASPGYGPRFLKGPRHDKAPGGVSGAGFAGGMATITAWRRLQRTGTSISVCG